MSLSTFGIKSDEKIYRREDEVVSAIERELLSLISQGFREYEIAEMMRLSDGTVQQTKFRMYKRLSLKNAAHAVAYAIRNKIIE